jgi:hypothetical protein
MNKQILASLLIASTTFAHGMESNAWSLNSLSLRSLLPAWLVSNESQLILDLRTSKKKFEDDLQDSIWGSWGGKHVQYPLRTFFGTFHIDEYAFFLYCYCYESFHENIFIDLRQGGISHPALDKCKAMRVCEHSALGATMIARNASIKEKREFIQELLKHDFKPTQKDIQLAELILYDGIGEHQKTLIHLLYPSSKAMLPQEIRTQIAQYLIQLFKNEFWLLPETALNDL